MHYPPMVIECTLNEDLFIHFVNEENGLDILVGPYADRISAENYIETMKHAALIGRFPRKEEDETPNP